MVDGEHINLSVYETKNKGAHKPTQAELRARANWELDRIKWPTMYSADTMHWRRWDYSPSGRLCVALTNPAAYFWKPEYLLGRWYDRKTGRVEDHLNDIIITMHSGAALIRHLRELANEKERIRQEAADRVRREEERKQRIAKREAFVGQKASAYAQLTSRRAFSEYLSSQLGPDAGPATTIGRVAEELVDRRCESGLES
jgi:hypothetical protein